MLVYNQLNSTFKQQLSFVNKEIPYHKVIEPEFKIYHYSIFIIVISERHINSTRRIWKVKNV